MAGKEKILHDSDDIDLELSLSIGGTCTSQRKPTEKSIPLKINYNFEKGVAESVSHEGKRQTQRFRGQKSKRRLMRKKENKAKNNLNLGLRVDRNGKKSASPNPIRSNTNCTYGGGSTSNVYGAHSTKGRTAQPLVNALVADNNMLEHRPPLQVFSIQSPAPIIGNDANSTSAAPIIGNDANSTYVVTDIDLNSPVQPPSIPPYIPRATTAACSPIPCPPIPVRLGCPISTVTATNPTGTTIKGLVYKHSRDDVIIYCVCCRHQLSALEFLRHAEIIDVANPLTCICITPF